MQATAPFSEERAELDAVLNSGLFARSPSLAQFLSYVCNRYFDGEADKIKEYNVAVEALGRPQDFDQKKDSIVRVEAHRLRKRLTEFYKDKGADHQIQIFIPPGNYVPQFIRKTVGSNALALTEVDPQPVTDLEVLVPSETPNGRVLRPPPVASSLPKLLAIAAILTVAVMATAIVLSNRRQPVQPQRTQVIPITGDEVRILAGSEVSKLVDHLGNVWYGDRFFQDGTAKTASTRPIARTLDRSIYLTSREGHFRYDIPLKPGVYELRLHFAETMYGEDNMFGGGETTRIFHVTANGKTILPWFDVVSDAGGSNTADIKVFKDIEPASDGKLHLEFVPDERTPFVNAIEIVPGIKGAMRPVRIIARDASFTDGTNRLWMPDHFFRSGFLIQRQLPISNTKDDVLYQSERYGNFSYVIPVCTNSRYTVVLHFCENWFGAPNMGQGGDGSRVFDVYCNGRTLLKNYDVYKDAGGALHPIQKVFKGIEPSAQGKISLDFVPVSNYAMINAIEVVEETR